MEKWRNGKKWKHGNRKMKNERIKNKKIKLKNEE